MADDKSKTAEKASDRGTDSVADRVADKVTDKASEIAKNIWLAGVGAYGRAVDEAQGRLEKAGVEPPKLFRELVKAGAALEDEARDAIEAGHAARSSVEDRINRVRENFNLQRPVRGEDLLALHAKIDRLAARLDALVDVLGAGAAQPASRPTTAKKPPQSRARAGQPRRGSLRKRHLRQRNLRQEICGKKTCGKETCGKDSRKNPREIGRRHQTKPRRGRCNKSQSGHSSAEAKRRRAKNPAAANRGPWQR
jgi:hypothetical protein